MQGFEAPKLRHVAVRLLSCRELMAEKRQSRSAVRNIPRGRGGKKVSCVGESQWGKARAQLLFSGTRLLFFPAFRDTEN